MLTTPRTFGEIARVGPIRRQAYKVSEMLADRDRTGYVGVALPEEMPVNETIELDARLRKEIGLALDADRDERDVAGAVHGARHHEAARAPPRTARSRAALSVHERVKAQRVHLRRLSGAIDAPVTTLPFVFESDSSSRTTSSSRASWLTMMPARRLPHRPARLAAGARSCSGCGADRRAWSWRSSSPVRGRGRGWPLRAAPSACSPCRSCAGGAGAGTSATTGSTSSTARCDPPDADPVGARPARRHPAAACSSRPSGWRR